MCVCAYVHVYVHSAAAVLEKQRLNEAAAAQREASMREELKQRSTRRARTLGGDALAVFEPPAPTALCARTRTRVELFCILCQKIN